MQNKIMKLLLVMIATISVGIAVFFTLTVEVPVLKTGIPAGTVIMPDNLTEKEGMTEKNRCTFRTSFPLFSFLDSWIRFLPRNFRIVSDSQPAGDRDDGTRNISGHIRD